MAHWEWSLASRQNNVRMNTYFNTGQYPLIRTYFGKTSGGVLLHIGRWGI